MDDKQEVGINDAAYRRLKDFIRDNYPYGRFVALSGGEIVADAATFEEVHAILCAMGKTAAQGMVVQAGVHHPDYLIILAQDQR